MRRISIAVLFSIAIAGTAWLAVSCRPSETPPVTESTPETVTELKSTVTMGDSEAAAQLLNGFYDVEGGSWRWTMSHFSVILAVPEGAAGKETELVMQFTIPQAVIDKLGPITLSAQAGEVTLPPETYTQAGDCVYQRNLPATAVTGEAVTITFSLDKFLPPSGTDQRELGVIVTSIGLHTS